MASQLIRLYQFLEQAPPGKGVSMNEMKKAAGVFDEQPVRNMLTTIRKERVPDPRRRGQVLPLIPIYYDRNKRLYFRSDRFTDENVDELTPHTIYDANLIDY